MKKISSKLKSILVKLYAFILGLLGFTSCNDVPSVIVGPLEYGSPYADYKFSGYVKNTKNEPIPDIEVQVNGDRDKTTTDKDGKFQLEFTASGIPVRLVVRDIDGEKNGSYKNDTIAIKVTDADKVKEGKKWYSGEYQKTNINITLQEPEATEE